MLSLEEGSVSSQAPDESGQEFNAYTLTGDYNGLIAAMIRFVEEDEGEATGLTNDDLLALLRAHIHRGVGTLSVRAKSPADIGRLAIAT
jgi:DNA sulfur modification protein DndE